LLETSGKHKHPRTLVAFVREDGLDEAEEQGDTPESDAPSSSLFWSQEEIPSDTPESLPAKYTQDKNNKLNLQEFQSIATELRWLRGQDLPPATATDLQDVFMAIDCDKIGAIRFSDLYRAQSLLLVRRQEKAKSEASKRHVPQEVLEALGKKHGKKDDDRITLAEARALTSELLQLQGLAPASLPDVAEVFHLLASDKKGGISFSELDMATQALQRRFQQRLLKAGLTANADASWRAMPTGLPSWQVGRNTAGKSGGKNLERRRTLKALLGQNFHTEQEQGKLQAHGSRENFHTFRKSFHGPRLSILNRQPELEFMKVSDLKAQGKMRYLLQDTGLQDEEGTLSQRHEADKEADSAQPTSKRRLSPSYDEDVAVEGLPRRKMPTLDDDAVTEDSAQQVHPSPQMTPTASASSSLQELTEDKTSTTGTQHHQPLEKVTLLSRDILLSTQWHEIQGLHSGIADASPEQQLKSPTALAGVREVPAIPVAAVQTPGLPLLQGTKVEILPPRPATVMGTVSTAAKSPKASGWLPRTGCESAEGAACKDGADLFGTGRGISSCATTARGGSDSIAGRDVVSSASIYEVWMKTGLHEESQVPPRPHTSCSAIQPKHSSASAFGPRHTPRSDMQMASMMESDYREPEPRPHPRTTKVAKDLSPMQAYEKGWDWSALNSFLESMNSEDLPEPELAESSRRNLVVTPREPEMKPRPQSEMSFASTRLSQTQAGRLLIKAPEPLRARSVQGNADQAAEPFPVQNGRPLTLSDALKKTPTSSRPGSRALASPLSVSSSPASASPTKFSRGKAPSKAFHIGRVM